MSEDQALDIIIEFVKASRIKGKKKDKKITDGGIEITNCSYLLNQLLRNITIPEDHYHISVEAQKLWNELTSSDIKDFEYDEMVKCDKINGSRVLDSYKGNENKPTEMTVEKDGKIKYNNVFHNEHVIPIKVIIQKLQECDLDDREKVKEILEKIHICRITKEEDKKLKPKSNRPCDYDDIVKGIYCNACIYLTDYDYD